MSIESRKAIPIIGMVSSGKSTFLKLLSGELETTSGEITITKGERISILKQDHYEFDDKRVMDVVLMGNTRLYEIIVDYFLKIYTI